MKKLLFILSYLLSNTSFTYSQYNCNSRIETYGGVEENYGRGVYINGKEEVFITGRIKGYSNFNDTTIYSSSSNIFLLKKDKNGNTVWIKQAEGSGFDNGDEVTLDSEGYIYVCGWFEDIIYFDNITLTSQGGPDFFLAKFDTLGDIVWAKSGGGGSGSWDRALSVTTDLHDNIYLTGHFQGVAQFEQFTLTSYGNTDIFVSKYNSIGDLKWVKQYGGIGKDSGIEIKADDLGNIYHVGYISETALFDSIIINSEGLWDIYISKISNDGDLQWINQYGGVGLDLGIGLEIDNLNQMIYVTGSISNEVVFDSIIITVNGQLDVFVSKFDFNGQLDWVKSFGGDFIDEGFDISVDNGRIYTTGYYSSAFTVDSVQFLHRGQSDIFLIEFDTSGNLSNHISIGSSGIDKGLEMTTYNNTKYIVGAYNENQNILDSTIKSDVLLWKVCEAYLDSSELVWPGDATNDGIANAWDILPIGLIYSQTGYSRPNANISWNGQVSPDWDSSFISGLNYKFTDCNGDSIINIADLNPILLNYGQSHNKALNHNGSSIDPLLYLELHSDTVSFADTVVFSIKLGTDFIPAIDMYGLAFSILYDASAFQHELTNISFSPSWLGDINTELISIVYDSNGIGMMDIGLTRIDQTSKSGSGIIGEVSMITIDNVSGKDILASAIILDVQNVVSITDDGSNIDLDYHGDTLYFNGLYSSIAESAKLPLVSVYPNPVNEILNIKSNSIIDNFQIFNCLGKVEMDISLSEYDPNVELNINEFQNGIYLIRIQIENGETIYRKIIIQN